MITDLKNPRREFLGKLAAGSTLALPALLSSLNAEANIAPAVSPAEADEWFKKIKGKHRIIYDAPEPHNGFPIIWSYVFYKTNNATGTPDSELTAVVVLRHNGIPLAMEDRLWEKYKFGEMFKITDTTTNAAAIRNPYNVPTDQMWTTNGIEGIKALSARGVMFCVCDMALSVYSGMAAKGTSMTPEEIKKDWLSGLLPGVQPVPSGVWAIGRAQENKCAYCYAGG
jgi:intracellular sulfur oxidation DsrE/DsrF family protein